MFLHLRGSVACTTGVVRNERQGLVRAHHCEYAPEASICWLHRNIQGYVVDSFNYLHEFGCVHCAVITSNGSYVHLQALHKQRQQHQQ